MKKVSWTEPEISSI